MRRHIVYNRSKKKKKSTVIDKPSFFERFNFSLFGSPKKKIIKKGKYYFSWTAKNEPLAYTKKEHAAWKSRASDYLPAIDSDNGKKQLLLFKKDEVENAHSLFQEIRESGNIDVINDTKSERSFRWKGKKYREMNIGGDRLVLSPSLQKKLRGRQKRFAYVPIDDDEVMLLTSSEYSKFKKRGKKLLKGKK